MAEKLFYTMGEVSEMFDVRASLLRYWEEQFPTLRPKRNKKGNRLYTPQDVEQLKLIYHLVKERGMKIEGAKKALKEQRKEGSVSRNAQLMERLQKIRAMLVEVREDLKLEESDIAVEESVDATAAPAPEIETPRETPRVIRIEEPQDDSAAPAEGKPKARRTRKKKADAENKELFAFYEQSLF
ncbi:MAG: MerR family transcriptional regulator [Rikenellaceae bacterium]|nr:MerR family transcriptional regulator [Rikenellaceae bacterium]